jgi:hypothetical protein
MALFISIEKLEATINHVRRVAPPVDGVLSQDLCTLAEVYGTMIYARAKSVDLDLLAEDIRLTAIRSMKLTKSSKLYTKPGKTNCTYGPNTDACEVCQ